MSHESEPQPSQLPVGRPAQRSRSYDAKRIEALKARRACGQLSVELALACMIIIPLSILGASLIVQQLAISVNDSACRDAARAAAQANNSATSLQLASAAMVSHATTGTFYGPSQLLTSQFVYEDFAGNPPANVSPYVQVTAQIPCVVPAPIAPISGVLGIPSQVTFSRTYRFPIVKEQLYLPSQ